MEDGGCGDDYAERNVNILVPSASLQVIEQQGTADYAWNAACQQKTQHAVINLPSHQVNRRWICTSPGTRMPALSPRAFAGDTPVSISSKRSGQTSRANSRSAQSRAAITKSEGDFHSLIPQRCECRIPPCARPSVRNEGFQDPWAARAWFAADARVTLFVERQQRNPALFGESPNVLICP